MAEETKSRGTVEIAGKEVEVLDFLIMKFKGGKEVNVGSLADEHNSRFIRILNPVDSGLAPIHVSVYAKETLQAVLSALFLHMGLKGEHPETFLLTTENEMIEDVCFSDNLNVENVHSYIEKNRLSQ